MNSLEDRDAILWSAIESGTLDDSAATDTEIAQRYTAYKKIESLFALLREPSPESMEDDGILEQPSQIGRYQVIRVLGEGGFGRVYLAHDPTLDRLVAIKIPRTNLFSTDEDVDRFVQEAKLGASLNHPGIVTIYDAVREGRSCFIVMEYVEGDPLDTVMSEGRLGLSHVVEIVRQIAGALHYAHKRGFVHRDLKPGNIYLDSNGVPHIGDFGLAVTEQTQLKQRDQIAGTPPYMSPEQIRGETHRLDGRSDIWSLGVILYELLTGRHPFLVASNVDVFDEILNRQPKPPRQIDDTIPVELERICLRCLEKDVNNRFSTAADIAASIATLDKSKARRRFAWLLCGIAGLVVAAVAIPFVALSFLDEKTVLAPRAPIEAVPAPKTDRESAKTKRPALFLGGNGAVKVPRLRYDGRSPITIELIFRMAHSKHGSLFGNINGSGLGLMLTGGKPAFVLHDAKQYKRINAKEALARNQKTHLAATFDGKKMGLFVDGESQGPSPELQGFKKSNVSFFLGADPSSYDRAHQFSAGTFYGLRVSRFVRYTQDFDPPEVLEEDSDTWVLYMINEGHGNGLTDSSGNGFHGSIQNGTWIIEDE